MLEVRAFTPGSQVRKEGLRCEVMHKALRLQTKDRSPGPSGPLPTPYMAHGAAVLAQDTHPEERHRKTNCSRQGGSPSDTSSGGQGSSLLGLRSREELENDN